MKLPSLTTAAVVGMITALTAGALVAPPPALANLTDSFTVNSTDMTLPDTDLNDGVCDTGGGVCTLPAAVAQINALGSDNPDAAPFTITVPAGTYNFTSRLDLEQDITITGDGIGKTIFDGSLLDGERLFSAYSAPSTFEQLTMRNSTFGGVAAEADVTLDHVEMNHHNAPGGFGAALKVQGANATVTHSIFAHNTITDPGSTGSGAGIGVEEGNLTITDSVFHHNVATGYYGGGAYSTGDMTLTRVYAYENSAYGGSAFYNDGHAMIVDSSTFENNHLTGGSNGGALYSYGWKTATLSVSNSTFVGNDTSNGANDGGLAIGSDGPVTITASTFVSNQNQEARNNRVISNGGPMTVTGSVFAGTQNLTGSGVCGGNDSTTFSAVLVDNPKCFLDPNDPTHTQVAEGITVDTTANIALKPLSLNAPGKVPTMAMAASSSAISFADWTLDTGCPDFDARGLPRPTEETCTLGAYEFNPLATTPDQQNLTSTGAGATPQSVTATVPTGGSITLLDQGDPATGSQVTVTDKGTFALDPSTGEITFTPVVGFLGTATVSFRVSNAAGQSTDSTYTATVTKPAPPSSTTVTSSGGNGTQSATVEIPTGGFATLALPGGGTGTTVTIPGKGTFTLDPATGQVTFSPEDGFSGTASVTIRITDAYGQFTDVTYQATVPSKPGPSPSPTQTPSEPAPQTTTSIRTWSNPTALGMPKVAKKSKAGVYLGVKGEAWKFALKGKSKGRAQYRVVIKADQGTISNLRKMSIERHDKVKIKGNKIVLKLRQAKGVDAIKFLTTEAATKVTVKVKTKGRLLSKNKIHLGTNHTKATSNPAVVTRTIT